MSHSEFSALLYKAFPLTVSATTAKQLFSQDLRAQNMKVYLQLPASSWLAFLASDLLSSFSHGVVAV